MKKEEGSDKRLGSNVINECDSMTDSYNQHLGSYMHLPSVAPLVTPVMFPQPSTVVSQHHLNHIQRNIFLQTNPDATAMHQHAHGQGWDNIAKKHEEEKKELVMKVKELEQRLSAVQDKHEDQIMAYKEKLDETKQDLREARQSAKFAEAMHARQSCIIS
jgi:hypothetical protein